MYDEIGATKKLSEPCVVHSAREENQLNGDYERELAEKPIATDRPIFLVSERFGSSAGGEAIKAQQYADILLAQGHDFLVFTHERSKCHGATLPSERMRFVDETPLQLLFWRIRILRPLLSIYFHLKARKLVLKESRNRPNPILHYISPVSPVALRFPPRGFKVVMGPLTGNIYYPPNFRSRMTWSVRIREQLHAISQILLGLTFREKRRADAVLVSGYERTRKSLQLAGCPEANMIDVVDAGVSQKIFDRPRITHSGVNPRFACSGRLVDHKGVDLAIKALALASPSIELDIYGDGAERQNLEVLTKSLGLKDRVRFHGWLARHEDLLAAYDQYRGYLFPSLAEANGIVMQEAMTIGLPVVALRWGGPAMLADDDAACYIELGNEEQIVQRIAHQMNILAEDGELADRISARARKIAERKFTWESVTESWQKSYENRLD